MEVAEAEAEAAAADKFSAKVSSAEAGERTPPPRGMQIISQNWGVRRIVGAILDEMFLILS
jgi:hypothetical protein